MDLVSRKSLSHVWLFVTLWTSACQASLSFIISWSLLKLMSIESVMPCNHLILYRPLLLLPSIFPNMRVFSNESALHISWPKMAASASASVLLMSIEDLFPLGLTGLISLQSKGLSRVFSRTTVCKHQFFGAEHFYGPTLISVHDYWKTVALTIWTFASEVMCLFFNMLSGFVIAFLPRSKHLLISWL